MAHRTSILVSAVMCASLCLLARPATSAEILTGPAAFGDWRADAPGVTRHIEAKDLPAPYATKPDAHPLEIVPRPAGALPKVPPGFDIAVFAEGLEGPRLLRVAPNGDTFVAETRAGRVKVIPRPAPGKTGQAAVYAANLSGPFGIAFYPPGTDPQWIYIANTGSVIRFPYRNGDRAPSGPREVIVPHLPTGGHSTRDVAFSADGEKMFVSVGSASNIAEEMGPKPLAQAKAWDEKIGATGAGWGVETSRADVLEFDPLGKSDHVYATGIRNCVGLAVDPSTRDVWCSTNERDLLGDNLVPDYGTRVRAGGFYGWPWFYIGNHEDPRLAGQRPDLADKVTVPDVLLQPHSAPLQMTFYTGQQFPADYHGDAFVASHGSWNRAHATGYKVIRIKIQDGVPRGDYQDFVTGFVIDDDRAWGRPVGVAVDGDGALLISDDGNGFIWRVSAHPAK